MVTTLPPIVSVIVGSEPNQHESNQSAPVVRLRHEAGLTAGGAMLLKAGDFQFGPLRASVAGLGEGEPETVSFGLTVESADRVFASRGTEPLAVEGVLVDGSVELRPGDIIQLATDHFTIERSDPDQTSAATNPLIRVPRVEHLNIKRNRKLVALFLTLTIVGSALALVQDWLLIVAGLGAMGLFGVLLRHRRAVSSAEHRRTLALAAAKTEFSAALRHARADAARDLRRSFPGPAGITDLVTHGSPAAGPSVGHLSRTMPFSGKIAIASGDLSWSPQIEGEGVSGWDHQAILAINDFLAAVPFTIDIGRDTIGIVAPRRAALASARHLLTAARTLGGDNLQITVVASDDRAVDWRWLDPKSGTTATEGEFEIRLFDGVAPAQTQPGSVVLAEAAEELVIPCDIVLIINDDGTAAAVMGPDQRASGLVPHGITESHAESVEKAILTRDSGEPTSRDEFANAEPFVKGLGAILIEPIAASETAGDDDSVIDLRPIPAAPATSAPAAPSIIDLTLVPSSYAFLNERLMVVGEPSTQVTALIASAALEQAAMYPSRSIFVLDRGDRSLIRLAQIPTCRQYAAIDDIDAATRLIQQLEDHVTGHADDPALVLVADIGRALTFYALAGRSDLAERLETLLHASTSVNAAASTAPNTQDQPVLADRFLVWIHPSTDDHGPEGLRMTDPDGEHRLDDSLIPGRDMTGRVAALKSSDVLESRQT